MLFLMLALPPDAEGIEITIEFHGLPESSTTALRALFNEPTDDVVFSHSFGGTDLISVITTLGRSTFQKLLSFFPNLRSPASKTTFKIDKTSLTMNGYTIEDINALLASPQFLKAVRAIKSK